MNTVVFRIKDGLILEFTLSGHCTADGEDETGRLVCSAVSSAAYLTCNTITEVIGAKPVLCVDESYMKLTLTDHVDACQVMLKGFRLHMTELAKQYTHYMKVNTEVS